MKSFSLVPFCVSHDADQILVLVNISSILATWNFLIIKSDKRLVIGYSGTQSQYKSASKLRMGVLTLTPSKMMSRTPKAYVVNMYIWHLNVLGEHSMGLVIAPN